MFYNPRRNEQHARPSDPLSRDHITRQRMIDQSVNLLLIMYFQSEIIVPKIIGDAFFCLVVVGGGGGVFLVCSKNLG